MALAKIVRICTIAGIGLKLYLVYLNRESMQQRNNNRYTMQMAVQALMEKRKSLWEANEFISESVGYMIPRLEKARHLFDAQEGTSTEGLTISKNLRLDQLCADCWQMSKRLVVFARKKGDTTLLAEVDRPKSYFDYISELERLARCAAITERAGRYISELALYKITSEELARLNQELEQLRPLSSQRDAVGDIKQTLTNSLPKLLQEVQEKLYELDDEMVAFMDGEEAFQEEYFVSRRITDRSATREGKGES
jgi:DNA gyrase/topoisomerase IV subunit A